MTLIMTTCVSSNFCLKKLKVNTWKVFKLILWKILLIPCQTSLLPEAEDSSSDIIPTSFWIIVRPLPHGISSLECLKSDFLLDLLICGNKELVRAIHIVPPVYLHDKQVIHCCRAGDHTGFHPMKTNHIGPLPGNCWHADVTGIHIDRKKGINVWQLFRQEACWKLTDVLMDDDSGLKVSHCLAVGLENRIPWSMGP